MATNTIAIKMHYNQHDERQVELVRRVEDCLEESLWQYHADRLQLLQTQPDHATVAWLTDMLNNDFKALSEQTDKAFAVAKRDSEARYDSLEAELAYRWNRLLRPAVKSSFGSWNYTYNHKSKTSTLRRT